MRLVYSINPSIARSSVHPFGPRLILAELACDAMREAWQVGANDHNRIIAYQLAEALGELIDLSVRQPDCQVSIELNV